MAELPLGHVALHHRERASWSGLANVLHIGRNKWIVFFRRKNQSWRDAIRLGPFPTKQEAAQARDEYLKVRAAPERA